MPHFYFHTHYKQATRDEEGVDLPDAATAWDQATQTSGHMIRDMNGSLEPGVEWRMDVTDHAGEVLFSMHFSAESCKT